MLPVVAQEELELVILLKLLGREASVLSQRAQVNLLAAVFVPQPTSQCHTRVVPASALVLKCQHSDDGAQHQEGAEAGQHQDGRERYVRSEVVQLELKRHDPLHIIKVSEGGKLVQPAEDKEHNKRETAGSGHEIVVHVLEGRGNALDCEVKHGHKCGVCQLLDRARIDDHKDTDEQQPAKHLGQLPEEHAYLILTVEEGDGLAQWRLSSRSDVVPCTVKEPAEEHE
mmetsp:Transcript_73258/g.162677  ORF Transcript_73258/g.162677 Transcript_73258/m.162677 type:complete len:227 (-) Transcript_73258:7-687(-)